MKSHGFCFVVVLLTLFGCKESQASDQKTLIFGVNTWCPHVCVPTVEDDSLGYTTDIVSEIFRARGFRIEIVDAPFKRLVQTSKHQAINLASIYREEAPHLRFADTPTGVSRPAFFVRKGTSWEFDGKDSLERVGRIGVILGATYSNDLVDQYVRDHPENVTAVSGNKTVGQLTNMLVRDRIDVAIADIGVMHYSLKRLGISVEEFHHHPISNKEFMFVGFSPITDNADELLSIYEEGIVELRKSGRLTEILDHYGVQDWEE